MTDASHPEPGVVAATAVYTVAGITYRQPFVAFEVDDERLAHLDTGSVHASMPTTILRG